jgi:photosystem II stability/assembly factor-like uncharacterized protein
VDENLQPPRADDYGVEMADDNIGLALTAAGILRTNDGGRSWTEPYPIASFTYGDLAFADAKRAWAVAGSGVIRRTDDAGITWQLQQSGTQVHLHRIAVVSPQEAWVTGSGSGFSDSPEPVSPPSVLLHTIDGGATWRNEPVAGYGGFLNVAFSGRTGWLVASPCAAGQPWLTCSPDHRVLLRTDDAGRNWQTLSETPGVVPERMQWLDAKHGFATSFVPTEPADGSGAFALYGTNDGGKHWARIESAPETVNEIRFQSARDGWISARQCTTLECHTGIWRTQDGGATWTPLPDPFGGGEFFAVTTDSLLLGVNQIDGPAANVAILDLKAATWSAAESAARQPFWSIHFADRGHGYALAYGRLLVTDDGGATWARGTAPSLFDSISVSGVGTVWGATICCNGGAPIHRSVDGGKTWQPLSVPFSAVSVIQAFGAQDAIATTAEGLFATGDGGSSWRRIESIPLFSESVTFIDPEDAWTLHCDEHTCVDSFRVTSDNGDTWETRPLPPGATISQFLTSEIGWATRLDCPGTGIDCSTVIFSSNDGGRTWDEAGRVEASLANVTFVGPARGWAISYDRAGGISIVATTDGGRTWARETVADGMFPAGFAKTADRLWLLTAVGIQGGSDRSTIYRRDFAPEPAPPPVTPRLRPPDTGNGSASTPPPLAAVLLALAAGLVIAASGIIAGRRRTRA